MRRDLKFLIALKQDFWFQLNSNKKYLITTSNFFYEV